MNKLTLLLLAFMASFTACELIEDTTLTGSHSYSGGETTIKIGSWSTETVGNGSIEINLDSMSFSFSAGSGNTKNSVDIFFEGHLVAEAPKTYTFEQIQPYAVADYWKETSSNIDLYSHDWGTGLVGSISIDIMNEDLIEGSFEFVAKEQITDYKTRTVKGKFSIPKKL